MLYEFLIFKYPKLDRSFLSLAQQDIKFLTLNILIQYRQQTQYISCAKQNMMGFKGLIPRNVLTIPTIQLIVKKLEENRKAAQFCIDFFQQIAKFQQTYSKNDLLLLEQNKTFAIKSPFNKRLQQCISEVINEQNVMCSNFHKSIQLLIKAFNQKFGRASTCIMKLEQSLESYRQQEENVFQISKKYYKNHKNLLNALQLYKNSFTDVNLIYNMDEKIKRYQNCNNLFQNSSEEYTLINKICDILTQKKKQISVNYELIQNEWKSAIKTLGLLLIQNTKQFIQFYQQFSYNCIDILHSFALDSQHCANLHLFQDEFDITKIIYFKNEQNLNVSKQFPILIQYHQQLKDQYLQQYNVQLEAYFQIVNLRLDQRKYENKKNLQTFQFYFKKLQRAQQKAKQILLTFEKKRKKIFESFGNRFISYFKSIISIFQIYASINKKQYKIAYSIFQTINNTLMEDSKLINLFKDQTQTNLHRFIVKKQLMNKNKNQLGDQNANANIRLIKKQMSQKAQFAKHMITGFKQKFQKNIQKNKKSYCQVLQALKQSKIELSQFCIQYIELYFGMNEFSVNIQKYNNDIQNTLISNCKFYHQDPYTIINNISKVSFQGQFQKINDFLKIKKPALADTNLIQKSVKQSFDLKQIKSTSSQKIITDEKQTKNLLFLMTKITFKQNEKLIKTFSCAFVEKIMLQGKIYITNLRVCFHSNFNSQNIFFGKTFIQFPKSDIRKIEKKLNSLIDNSISFTTQNGEILFTSFFSRNQAYDLICKSLEFNLDEHVYEYEENCIDQDLPQFLINCEEKDDIKISQMEHRKQKIDKLIQNYPYTQIIKIQIQEEGLNSLKIFKILFTQQNIIVGKKKYGSFLRYIKEKLKQKEIEVQEWMPSMDTILNQSNIKQSSALRTVRKIRSIVPLANTGIPFMPKIAKSEQTQSLYFYSKHKFIIDGVIETQGAPYTDTFRVHLRMNAQSIQNGKCSISFEYYINFIKPTIMKSVIQSKTKEETINGYKVWAAQIKAYFDQLVKKQKKKHQQKQDSHQLDKSEIQQQNEKILDNQKKNENRSTEIKRELHIWQSIAVISIVVNLIMFYIFII